MRRQSRAFYLDLLTAGDLLVAMATPDTQSATYAVRNLKGHVTRHYKRIINRCKEVLNSPTYDPDDLDILNDYRKRYEEAVNKYQEPAAEH